MSTDPPQRGVIPSLIELSSTCFDFSGRCLKICLGGYHPMLVQYGGMFWEPLQDVGDLSQV